MYVVPDTGLSWAKSAMTEVVERYNTAGVQAPQSLYMDCGCCSGREGCSQKDPGTSVAALWRSMFSVKLDARERERERCTFGESRPKLPS